MKIRVLIVDDSLPLREAMRSLLADNDKARVLAISTSDVAAGPTAAAGAGDFLAKPDLADELVDRILALATDSNISG